MERKYACLILNFREIFAVSTLYIHKYSFNIYLFGVFNHEEILGHCLTISCICRGDHMVDDLNRIDMLCYIHLVISVYSTTFTSLK